VTAPVLEAVRDDHAGGWTSETPQLVVAAYWAAEIELARPLQPGDTAQCCPAESLIAWPHEGGEFACPGCGLLVPAPAEVAA
jgi:hypothetical protein